MESIFYIILLILSYKLLMPFVGWIVPQSGMENAAKYIERTERRFPTKDFLSFFSQMRKRINRKKKL
jgi:hypothetical protein